MRFYHLFPCASPFGHSPSFPGRKLREEGNKHPVHHKVAIPPTSLGPLNALVTSIKDSGMDPPRSSDLRPHALSYMSSRALTPFHSEAAIYLNGLTPPSRGGAGPLGPLTKHKPRGHSGIHLPLRCFPPVSGSIPV